MMVFKRKNSMWSDVSPTGAVSDFVSVWRSSGRHRWRFVLAAFVASGSVLSLIIREEHRAPPRLPSITYINSWRADRSDEEIKASNLAFQKIKEDRAREQAEAEEETKKLYRTLGRISGMDVDKIERDAAAQRAAEAKAAAAEAEHAKAVQAAAAK
ncbi:hypothetical protein FHW96_000925 [Novosphingobium sp. SG751A]|uniref:hypothetical protein n=1 Tax=Novosphingobium sp. SG751A TaxID=2587000 RepID=UPI0015517630|nr:hypothetical protein [Novosphingobium sp. SG751A]NOW44779.1 hypothetical protein [Novosphingobium sp. SG751A]